MTRPRLLSFHRLTCGCKINLFLKIRDKLPNGYHTLESFFLPLSAPEDTLEVSVLDAEDSRGELHVACDTPGIDPSRNSLTKAYALYAEATGFAPALSVRLEKGIPHGSGLGGGSADAARFLIFIQALAQEEGKTGLSPAALVDLGARVGADVPFFLLNKPALARGTGEILEPVPSPCAGLHLVLACPDLVISTAWAFSLLDEARSKAESPEVLTRDAARATRPSFARVMAPGNDFEEVIFPAFPPLARICESLRRDGAAVVRLSGSGASLFGLFTDGETAGNAARKLRTTGVRVFTHAL
ncbi:MAG: 4-(cytidine 5'-diphospho)-2-C-methyl-D-erythritol kinase [Desulfovibrio sp.]|jgi:4-diphosphocytidyl-2-C-methyl-D-erythritol kinase|nr:4-(cytidine 5'-diphospho)-2-C-methyl-D-erythritol kinase [Desulfovibrio sp.]